MQFASRDTLLSSYIHATFFFWNSIYSTGIYSSHWLISDTICFTDCISLFWWKDFLYSRRNCPKCNARVRIYTFYCVGGDSVWFHFNKFVSKITSVFIRDDGNTICVTSFARLTNRRFNSGYNSLCNFEIGPSCATRNRPVQQAKRKNGAVETGQVARIHSRE